MSHTLYENFVLEHKVDSMLTTKLDMSQFLTPNTELTASPGMKVKVDCKTISGDAEDVEMGSDNTGEITITTTPKEYEVKVTQAKFSYYDEEEMRDPMVVDTGTQGLAEAMANDLTKKAIAEFGKATLKQEYTKDNGITFDDVSDAISLLNFEQGQQDQQLFGLLNPKTLGKMRKNLKDDLRYVEAYVRTGYIGTVCGVNLYTSKAVKDDEMIIATREAVTAFTEKGTEVEQSRVAGTRQNIIHSRKVTLVALTDETKVVLITPQDP